jgi:hypothetical protein
MLGSTFEPRNWPRASEEYQKATRAAPGNDVLFFNLGLIYAEGLSRRRSQPTSGLTRSTRRAIASREQVRASKVEETRAEVERLRVVVASEACRPRSAEYHRALAERLQAAGESKAANGHRLRAWRSAETVRRRPSRSSEGHAWRPGLSAAA